MDFIRRNIILIVLFLTGASVLVVEVVATRVLSPYYGNTIYTVSSVLGICLAALSLGYYAGGRFADTHTTEKWFYSIIVGGGLSVMLLQVLALLLLPTVGYAFSMTAGPLVFSVLLFFLPCCLLGTLSPFAITLQEKHFPDEGIGSISGKVFFVSTVGSIVGSLMSGFVLIPHLGVDNILFSVGGLLILIGVTGLIFHQAPKKNVVTSIVLGLIGAGVIGVLFQLPPSPKLVYAVDGVYEKISIYDDIYEGKKARIFKQDRSTSGVMLLDSDELAVEYTKYYGVYRLFSPNPKNTLVIGGGVYSVPKALLAEDPNVRVDVAEIEPSLLEISKKYFRVPEDDRLTNYIVDGRRLLYDTKNHYDLIFSDVYYSLFSIPSHFTTVEFFRVARDSLTDGGVFVANFIGELLRQEPSLIFSEIKTFLEVFPNSYFFVTNSTKQAKTQNIIFVGYKSDEVIDFSSARVLEHEDPFVRSLPDKLISLERFDLSPYLVLTDNYAPVEYLTADVVRRSFALPDKRIDGKEALAVIEQLVRLGPRSPSQAGHKKAIELIEREMAVFADEVVPQRWTYKDAAGIEHQMANVIARFSPENKRRVIIGSHFDSKRFADKDSKAPTAPVPGANDSSSGVAVMFEIARYLANDPKKPAVGIDLVFFDGEEGEEDLSKTDWRPIGSEYFAAHLTDLYGTTLPELGIVIDMICDKDLQIYFEKDSLRAAGEPLKEFFRLAQQESPGKFYAQLKYEIRDDHTSLNNAGVPSFLLIDFDYPYFHTTKDTPDKCSAKSLEAVGTPLLRYLYTL